MKIVEGLKYSSNRNLRCSNLVLKTPDLWQVWCAVSRHVYQVTPQSSRHTTGSGLFLSWAELYQVYLLTLFV